MDEKDYFKLNECFSIEYNEIAKILYEKDEKLEKS